jgi:hypothetical protein
VGWLIAAGRRRVRVNPGVASPAADALVDREDVRQAGDGTHEIQSSSEASAVAVDRPG